MKKSILILLSAGLAALLGGGCTRTGSDVEPGKNDSRELTYHWTLPGSMSIATYAVESTTAENRIYDLYVLFFDPLQSDKYVGCARSGVTSTTTSGSSRITMPEGYDVTDEWNMLFAANLEEYLPDGVTDAAAWLESELANKTISDAADILTVMSATAIQSPLLMSGRANKPAATNEVSVELARRVARIDVINSAGNFTLEHAQIWNARTYAYLMEEGGIPTGNTPNSFSDYTDNVAGQSDGKIQGKLYAFPNSSVPVTGDISTTCVIIGGTYTGPGGSGALTYYRLNIAANNAPFAELKGNNIYTINITNVSGDGEGSPGDAHNSENLQVSYSLNSWDDTYSILYVFDADGNALGVSQRFINFSYRGPQEVDIKVFRMYSDTNPLSGTWSVGTVTGTNASVFTAGKKNDGELTIAVNGENTGAIDRIADVVLSWGTIEMPLVLTQLSYSSQIENAIVSPNTLSFPLLNIIPKEVCISLQGDFAGVTRADIETAFIYYDSSDTGWLAIAEGSTADNPDMGLFYFNVWPSDYTIDGGVRQAELKFVIRTNGKVTTAQVDIYQSPDSFGDGELRIVEILCMEFSEEEDVWYNRGSTASLSSKMPGLPVGQNSANHLHFNIVNSGYVKYKMVINSSLDWEIVTTGVAAQALNFSQMSGQGNFAQTVEVEIEAVSDVDWGWDGIFYVQYADGQTTAVVVHQAGIISSDATGQMIYYGIMRLNGKLWLDRNTGATASMDENDPTVGYHNPQAGIANTMALGYYYDKNESGKSNACPPGFRKGRYATDGSTGEWDYIFNNLVYSGTTSTSEHPAKVWYLAYGPVDNVKYWYIPIAGNAVNQTGNNLGMYNLDNISAANSVYNGGQYGYYIELNASNGNKTITYTSNSGYDAYRFSQRCVYDSDYVYPDEP